MSFATEDIRTVKATGVKIRSNLAFKGVGTADTVFFSNFGQLDRNTVHFEKIVLTHIFIIV